MWDDSKCRKASSQLSGRNGPDARTMNPVAVGPDEVMFRVRDNLIAPKEGSWVYALPIPGQGGGHIAGNLYSSFFLLSVRLDALLAQWLLAKGYRKAQMYLEPATSPHRDSDEGEWKREERA